ncbi:hypothetical protein Nepgr_025242 [Nepenthes gracilis]|uniref:DYW domain-containing protein n=1 Tax=Nepenthes gracilis TaxID=150966 RepID=A0AAD3Y0S8_NEPGR|nr:hypothetical protein Nepgr_025242 [Nepenthes gracilis]
MVNLILPSKPRTPVPIPSKQDIAFELSAKPIKATFSLTKTQQTMTPKITDAHLHYLCRTGRFNEVITALDAISQDGRKVKSSTFTQLLDCCIEHNSIQLGRELHARVCLVDEILPFVETKLVSMYAKCGSLVDARKVFDEMSERNLYSWSAMIGAYSREQRSTEVLILFSMMMEEGTLPDDFLFPKILQACGNCGNYEIGRMIHSLVVRCGMISRGRVNNALLSAYVKCSRFQIARRFFEKMDWRDRVSWNSIIAAYCQMGKNDEAHRLFDAMRKEGIEPGLVTWNILIASYSQLGNYDTAMELMKKMESFHMIPDVFTWTSLISGFSRNNRIIQALDLFREMLFVRVKPNRITITSAVAACATLKALENGKEIHSLAVKIGFSECVLVGNSLLNMYSKCGELEAARRVFDAMSEKDTYTWNSMIGGYFQGGYCGEAYDLFMKMQVSRVQPNAVTWNVMISGYFQNGDDDQAIDLFWQMGKGGGVKPNTSSWNSLISGYLQIGDKNKAFAIFRQMQSFSIEPNFVTILTILRACANLVAANKVKEIHACVIRRNLEPELAVANSLIDTYAKSGNFVYTKAVFDSMSSKDAITWDTLIACYVLHGFPNDAIYAFNQMKIEGHVPSRGTFVGLITAYGLLKKVEKGKQIYSNMTEDYQILPGSEHFAAMVDLFGRSGKLEDAIEFVKCMDIEPESAIWDSLLTACRSHGNVAMAIRAGEHLLELNPQDNVTHQLVSHAYDMCGRSAEFSKERPIHKKSSATTNTVRGCSLVEVENTVYSFVTGDLSIHGFDSIDIWLKGIARNMKQPDSHDFLCIEEEEKEAICGVHSEKLAMGFVLAGAASNVRCVRIMKNFRVCRDCHSTAKFVSSSYGCEIYLSDTKCLHHFKDGLCSCGDYW